MSQEVVDFSAFHSRLRIPGVLYLDTALRIGTGRSGSTGVELPVVKDVVGRPYIPGSSFKGAYRAHLEALLRAFDPRLACVSVPRPQNGDVPGCLTQKQVDELKDKPELKDDPAKLNRAIIEGCCWACRLCGAPWLASKVLVRDLIVQEESWFGRYVERDGVAIDRDTGTAGNKLKYNFEAVPPGTAFTFEMVVENATEAEQGLALLGLREFEEGRVALGGGRSRGLGRVTLALDWEQAEVVDRASLREYLATGRGQRLNEEKRKALLDAFLAEIAV